MTTDAAIMAFIQQHGEDAIRKLMTKKPQANRYDSVVIELKKIAENHPKVSLKIMRRLLKEVYGEDEENREKRKLSAYNEFFTSEMVKVKQDMPDADQKTRVKEIAARWNAKKGAAESTFPESDQTSDNESAQPVKSKYKRPTKGAKGAKRANDDPESTAPTPKRATRATRATAGK
jgi:hypothetical protein